MEGLVGEKVGSVGLKIPINDFELDAVLRQLRSHSFGQTEPLGATEPMQKNQRVGPRFIIPALWPSPRAGDAGVSALTVALPEMGRPTLRACVKMPVCANL